jgi:hypothetical protein
VTNLAAVAQDLLFFQAYLTLECLLLNNCTTTNPTGLAAGGATSNQIPLFTQSLVGSTLLQMLQAVSTVQFQPPTSGLGPLEYYSSISLQVGCQYAATLFKSQGCCGSSPSLSGSFEFALGKNVTCQSLEDISHNVLDCPVDLLNPHTISIDGSSDPSCLLGFVNFAIMVADLIASGAPHSNPPTVGNALADLITLHPCLDPLVSGIFARLN